MFCDKCGTQVESGQFCPNCGNRINAQQPNVPTSQPAAAAAQPTSYWNAGTYQAPAAPLAGGPNGGAIDVVRRIATSNLFLVAAALYSLAVLLSFIGALSTGTSTVTAYASYTYGGKTTTVTSPIVGALAAMIPTGLLVLGMWLTYAGGRDTSKPMPTSGLTIIKVLLIIGMVFVILAAVLMVIAGVFLIVLGSQAPNGSLGSLFDRSNEVFEELMRNESFRNFIFRFARTSMYVSIKDIVAIMAVLMFVIAALLVFFSVFMGRVIHTINLVKQTILTNRALSKISTFAAVCCFIFGCIQVINGFSMLVNGNALSGIATLLSAATEICFGVLQFQYRNEMRKLGG